MKILALFEHPLALQEAVNGLARLEALGEYQILRGEAVEESVEPKLVLGDQVISTGVSPAQHTQQVRRPLEDQLVVYGLSLEDSQNVAVLVREGKAALMLKAQPGKSNLRELLSEAGATQVLDIKE